MHSRATIRYLEKMRYLSYIAMVISRQSFSCRQATNIISYRYNSIEHRHLFIGSKPLCATMAHNARVMPWCSVHNLKTILKLKQMSKNRRSRNLGRNRQGRSTFYLQRRHMTRLLVPQLVQVNIKENINHWLIVMCERAHIVFTLAFQPSIGVTSFGNHGDKLIIFSNVYIHIIYTYIRNSCKTLQLLEI